MHVRTGLEQARLQVPERRAHFVEYGRAILSHLARQPQQLDLALERFLDQSYRVWGSGLTGKQTFGNARRRPSSVLRVDSVGCAVRTGRMSSASIARSMASALAP